MMRTIQRIDEEIERFEIELEVVTKYLDGQNRLNNERRVRVFDEEFPYLVVEEEKPFLKYYPPVEE